MSNSRQNTKIEHVNWFNVVYQEFLKDNKGYFNPLEYIEGVYKGSKSYWASVARCAGFEAKRRNGVYYFGVKQSKNQ